MNGNRCGRLLAFVTGLVNQELLLQNEYLAAESRVLRAHLPARLRLSDPERCTLAEIGKRLGSRALAKVACAAKPDTILAWRRRLIDADAPNGPVNHRSTRPLRAKYHSRHRARPGRTAITALVDSPRKTTDSF